MLLQNPVSLVVYAVVARRFFKARIQTEERALLEFFPVAYAEYKSRTIVGLPL